jgi:hypothetical protein
MYACADEVPVGGPNKTSKPRPRSRYPTLLRGGGRKLTPRFLEIDMMREALQSPERYCSCSYCRYPADREPPARFGMNPLALSRSSWPPVCSPSPFFLPVLARTATRTLSRSLLLVVCRAFSATGRKRRVESEGQRASGVQSREFENAGQAACGASAPKDVGRGSDARDWAQRCGRQDEQDSLAASRGWQPSASRGGE